MPRTLVLLLGLTQVLLGATDGVRLFTVEDGLVRNWISRIKLDRVGLLWFCTIEGVSIFDGQRFTNFTTRDGLPSGTVADVLHTVSGQYWLATGAGLARFHPRPLPSGTHFEIVGVGGTSASNTVSALLEDSARRIWVGTNEGLYRFTSTPNPRPERVSLPGSTPPVVSGLVEDGRRRIWVATDRGLFLIGNEGYVEQVPTPKLPRVDALLRDQKGRLWAGGRGLIQIDGDAERPATVAVWTAVHPLFRHVLSLHEDARGALWAGGFGAVKLLPDAGPKLSVEALGTSVPSAELAVFSIATDRGGNLWTAVANLGARRISREQSELFTEKDGLASAFIAGVFEDRRGRLIAVTDTPRAFHELTGDRFARWELNVPGRNFQWGWGIGSVALQDREGAWWAASGQGLLRYGPGDDLHHLASRPPRVYRESDGLTHPVTLRLFEDSRGDVWAGSLTGIARRERTTGKWISYATGFEAMPLSERPAVHAIAEDRTGAIWVGLTVPTLLRIRGDRVESIAAPQRDGGTKAFLVDSSGQLWIGSSHGRVALIRNPAEERPRLEIPPFVKSLSSDYVSSLAEDRFGRLYIAGGRGVDRYDGRSGTVRRLTGSSVLPGGEITHLYRDRSGAIWFSSFAGLARYRPESDRTLAPSQPLVRAILIGAERHQMSIGVTGPDRIELASNQDNIAIEFRAPHFIVGERLRYQYRIAEHREWSPPSETETVHYANLSPGNHRFEVRTVGETGLLSAPATLEFHLAAPFWRRTWVLAIAAIAICAGVYSLHRYRLNYLLMVERVRTRLAIDLHDDLGAGLAEIAILSEVAKRRPGEPLVLEQVAQRARGMRAAMSDIVWTVDPSRDRLSDLVHRMRETAVRLLESEKCRVEFSAPAEESLEAVELPPDVRRHLLLFFKEAITNVARHSEASFVRVEVQLVGERLRLQISDNGRGFDPYTPHAGQGLLNMRWRADQIGGTLRIDSAPGAEWTSVCAELSAPVRRFAPKAGTAPFGKGINIWKK